ncbi:MAG: aminopeptidase P family protein [Anaerolineales bacterium]|nr:aminopeptidase P family protein [Anaerolineales bacterium]
MKVNWDRIHRVQKLMAQQGMIGLMIMTRDDFRYFFGQIRVQPRAIVPVSGPPILVASAGEEEELRRSLGDTPIRIFQDVMGQMTGVRQSFRDLLEVEMPPDFVRPQDGKPRVGMQLWFDTPAFLVDLFRKLNRDVELVSSDPVMDALRMVKEPAELDFMRRAQEIAALGMDRVKQILRPGISGHEIATETLYCMMKAGAEGTSTPIHVNAGLRSCWIHGTADKRPIELGNLVVVDLTPQVEGYCANLARTFVLGSPNVKQQLLFRTYQELKRESRSMLKPGARVMDIDKVGKEICQAAGLGEYHIDGISHGIGLRFEEIPASTIIKGHRRVELVEGMTVTVGHTILAIPGLGGFRQEDVYRVTPTGGEVLAPYPEDDWVVEAG